MRRPLSVILILIAVCGSCAREAPMPAQAHTATVAALKLPEPPPPPKLRLGSEVSPVHYSVKLRVVPTESTFGGTIDIALEVHEPTTVVWLNANDLALTRVEATVNDQRRQGHVVDAPKDFVGVLFDQPLTAGAALLHVEYTGQLGAKETSGASRQKEGDDWYVFTHFEPIDARRVFPCFDEPSFKVPWQISLEIRNADQAFSNTPVASEAAMADGFKVVRFAETKPLPSYLIAFAVGPIEAVEAPKSPKSGTPIRILVPRGKKDEARWAAVASAQILSRLEDYFGIDYPFGKLDCIAVPFGGGAMEHPGLITFGETLILSRPEKESIGFRRRYASIAAHEFAHQWFGDLVTTAWWDDIWLNEAFATWMEPKIIEQWQPAWGAREGRVSTRSGAMGTDSLMTARQIRQPITSDDDIHNAFDGITYGKGASVIGMFEGWVGIDVFRKGVQQYMKEHAYGVATAKDFLSAISAAAGKDIAPPFSTFLDQPGVPLVTATLECASGKSAALRLSQQRYLPEGSEGAPQSANQTWQIPICARWSHGKETGRACTLLSQRSGSLSLEGLNGCPDWVLPNENESGYYRTLLGGDLLARLLKNGGQALTVPERLGVIGDMSALVRAGRILYGDALGFVSKLAQDPSRYIVQATIGLVASLRDQQMFPDSERPKFARFIRDVFGKQAHKLGWVPKKSDDEDTRLLRSSLLPLVADQGEDASLVSEAKKLALSWLEDHHSVDPDIVDAVLEISAYTGDREWFDRLHAAASAEPDPADRRRMLSAMGNFRNPELARSAMALTLTDAFDARESMRLLYGATRSPQTRPIAYEFVKTNFDALAARLPRDAPAGFPGYGAALCDDEHRADVESFFKERAPRFAGGPRILAQALEGMKLCAEFRKKQGPSVARFLASR
jgi:cytosol alanyl aminopeptidase